MLAADTVVKARVPLKDKEDAVRVLEKFGLSMSDLIRLTIRRVADEEGLPFDLRPRETSLSGNEREFIAKRLRQAIEDTKVGRTYSTNEVFDEIMKELRL